MKLPYNLNMFYEAPKEIVNCEKIDPELFKKWMAKYDELDNPEKRHVYMDVLMAKTLELLGYSEGVLIFLESEKWYA